MDSCNLRISALEGRTTQPNDGATADEQGENSGNINNDETGQNQGEQEADQLVNPAEGQQRMVAQGQGVLTVFRA